MRLERTTQCSRLRCGYIVDVLSANLSLGYVKAARDPGTIANVSGMAISPC
jgi:hypothetical protein